MRFLVSCFGAVCRRFLDKNSHFSYDFRRNLSRRVNMKYDEAVRTLNVLQKGVGKPKIRDESCLVAMQEYLERVRILQSDLTKLNIIHISGTKGKGSTSAFVESILRHHGYKTGFFSSPHLIEVRERIRINGSPISKAQFADYFEHVYSRFMETKEGSTFELPSYFYYLTTMAFHVFIQERVDVAIMEVGIGGAFDCTNVIESSTVCGVTSLGYDHVHLLGNTIESIAWHKSGIFKPGSRAFSSPQPYSAMQVLAQSALDAGIQLQTCPDLSMYDVIPGREIRLGLDGDHQRSNASLALQISASWMKNLAQNCKDNKKFAYSSEIEAFPSPAGPFLLTEEYLDGLENCRWRGRAQIMKFDGLTFFLDGAHTVKSMQCCAKWFQEAADIEEKSLSATSMRLLVFNITGDRDAGVMFQALQDCDISHAVFTPNIATFVQTDSADQANLKSSLETQLLCAVRNHEQWCLMKHEQELSRKKRAYGQSTVQPRLEISPTKAPVFATIADAISWLSKGRDCDLHGTSSSLASAENYNIPHLDDVGHVQVLVTGSVHLVGGFLRILDPNMND